MLDPLDLEARLTIHAENVAKVDRHGWMSVPTWRGRRLRHTRDRVALALFALAARVDPEVVQARRRSEARSGRL